MKRRESRDSASPGSAPGTPIASPQRSIPAGENDEALVSERAGAGHIDPHSDSDNEERRVQFNRKDLKDSTKAGAVDDDDDAKKKLKG